jgi:hypothetical protein
VTAHVERLRTLVGATVESVHLLYGPDGWLPDAPVVLRVGGQQLEVCAWQLDLSLTWGVVDLDAPAWPTEDQHEWRPADVAAAAALLGAAVTAVEVVENSYSVQRRDTGEVIEGWLLSGLRVTAGGVPLTVYNALDQNGLAGEEGLEGVRYRPL